MLKQLKLYYVLVSFPFVTLLVGAVIFFDAIKSTLDTNPHPQINYTIFVILLGGGLIILLNVRRLVREARALVEFAKAIHAKMDLTTLRDLANSYTCDIACLLQMIATSGDRAISHQEQAALEHELANVHSRLNRRNALPQYLTGLLVGMGLLGTFIGLLATLGDIGALIGSFADLDMTTADPIVVFSNMIERMKAPMASMAIAFSASMFGLLGSIILGLMMVGIRRLQGDIFSTLSSETTRHIEMALSFESISFRSGDTSIGCYEQATDQTSKVLLRIEERLAETARIRQRALSTEIDDFKTQRADMLQALTEQTEANNSFRGELQQLGSQLGTIFNHMEQRNSEVSNQISDLTIGLAGDAKETHKLLAAQIGEQKQLLETLGSYNIDERLTESARVQQRSLNAVIEDFKQQREEMLQTLSEQNKASRDFRGELQQLGSHLATIFDSMENGNSEISSQISDLTVNAGADAKEAHRLMNITGGNVRSELQQLGKQLTDHLGGLSSLTELGTESVCKRFTELMEQLSERARESDSKLDSTEYKVREDLQQLDQQLGDMSQLLEKGGNELSSQLSELMHHRSSDAKESHELLAKLLSVFPVQHTSEQEE